MTGGHGAMSAVKKGQDLARHGLDIGPAHVLVHRQGEDPLGLTLGHREIALLVAERSAAGCRWIGTG